MMLILINNVEICLTQPGNRYCHTVNVNSCMDIFFLSNILSNTKHKNVKNMGLILLTVFFSESFEQ